MTRHPRRAAGMCVLALLAVLGAGCSAGAIGGTDTDPGMSPAVRAPSTPLPMDGRSAYSYPGGMQVIVGVPRRYTVPLYAGGYVPGNPAVTFTVVLVNTSAYAVDVSQTVVTAGFGPEGVQAEPIYAVGVGEFPASGTLAAGRRTTVTMAFSAAVSDLSVIDVSVQLQPGALPAAVFTGAVR